MLSADRTNVTCISPASGSPMPLKGLHAQISRNLQLPCCAQGRTLPLTCDVASAHRSVVHSAAGRQRPKLGFLTPRLRLVDIYNSVYIYTYIYTHTQLHTHTQLYIYIYTYTDIVRISGHGSSFRDVCGCGALAAGRHGKRRLLLNPKNDPKVHISIHTRFLETTTTWINLERARKLQVTL